MLKALICLLSFTAAVVFSSASTLLEDANLHNTTQLRPRATGRRVSIELNLELSYAIIPNYGRTPIGPAILYLYIEADGDHDPALMIDIRVIEFSPGVILPVPVVQETVFPAISAQEEESAIYMPYGPGGELYPLGRTHHRNSDILNVSNGRGLLLDQLAEHSVINERQDANNLLLHFVNRLNLEHTGSVSDLDRMMDFVRGSRQWYHDNGVQYYCEMPLMMYQAGTLQQTYKIVDPRRPVLLSDVEVRDFIQSIAHRLKPPAPFDPFPSF